MVEFCICKSRGFATNVEATFASLKVGEYDLPITINDKEYGNSYVVSPYSIISYAEEEIARHALPFSMCERTFQSMQNQSSGDCE